MEEQEKNRVGRWFGNRRPVRLLLLAALLALAVLHSESMWRALLIAVKAAKPLIVGAGIAYVMEIVVSRLNRLLFPNTNNVWLRRYRRTIAMVLAFIMLISFFVLLVYIVIPGLADAVTLLARELPNYFRDAKAWVLANFSDVAFIREQVEPLEFDWDKVSRQILDWAGGTGLGGSALLTSTMNVVGAVAGEMADILISLIFAMFILGSKEKLSQQSRRLFRAVMDPVRYAKLEHVVITMNRSLSGFIIGQTLYGLISGLSTWLGMFIFRMPYAIMVGVLCGTCIIIPIIGGYLGAVIGTFLVFTANPSMAPWFLLFIVILQTVEGNLIYPRLLGNNMGMPGLWVLAAVTLGGGLGGIPGMLMSVPVCATVYALTREWVEKKEKEKEEKKEAEKTEDASPPRDPEKENGKKTD